MLCPTAGELRLHQLQLENVTRALFLIHIRYCIVSQLSCLTKDSICLWNFALTRPCLPPPFPRFDAFAKLFYMSSALVRGCTPSPHTKSTRDFFIGSRYLPTRPEHDTAASGVSILVSDLGCKRVACTLILFYCRLGGQQVHVLFRLPS